MNELARNAVEEEMIPNAPVQAARSVRIAAPLDKVWGVLVGVSDCERWYPYLESAELQGPFAAETRLTYGRVVKHKL